MTPMASLASPVLTSVITLHTTSPSFPRLSLLCVPCRYSPHGDPMSVPSPQSLGPCPAINFSARVISLKPRVFSTVPTFDCPCPNAPFPVLALPSPITLVQVFPKSFFEHDLMCSNFLLMTVCFCWRIPHERAGTFPWPGGLAQGTVGSALLHPLENLFGTTPGSFPETPITCL